VRLPEGELLRYPYFDVEFNYKPGAKKLRIRELMGLLGSVRVPDGLLNTGKETFASRSDVWPVE